MAVQVKQVKRFKLDQGRNEFETVPVVIPNASPETVFAVDVWLEEIHIVNPTAGAITITINDKQTSPQPVVPTAMSVASGTDSIWEFTRRYCPGGLTWQAGAPGLVGYVRGRE